MLAVVGRLDSKLGGAATRDLDSPRRSIYVKTVRWGDGNNFSTLFDAADPEQSVERRQNSIAAPQALFLLNNEFVLMQARRLVERITKDVGNGVEARIHRAYQLLFSRRPTTEELEVAIGYVNTAGTGTDAEIVEAAWLDYAQLLLCSNEFFYVD